MSPKDSDLKSATLRTSIPLEGTASPSHLQSRHYGRTECQAMLATLRRGTNEQDFLRRQPIAGGRNLNDSQ
jgi:hypothetical protein